MSNLVIVAIPDENHRVWSVSSEKVPHLTILFLGEVGRIGNLPSIVDFVEHAANTMLRRFYLPVDRRGELGADKADVLFFRKDRFDFKNVSQFRSALLQDTNIRTAYDAVTQFEGPWTPHLTLGYPDSPAKPDIGEAAYSRIYDVTFDRIAVWVSDFDGPEFLLKDYWEDDLLETSPMDVTMSDIRQQGEDFLEHFGVKGMKWGVRKAKAGLKAVGRGLAALGAQLADSGWQHSTYNDVKHEAVHNHVAKDLDNHIERLQRSPKYRGKDLKADSDLRKQYYQDVAKVTSSAYRRGVKEVYGENYTGTKSAHYVTDARGPRIEVRNKHTGEVDSESPLTSMREIKRRRAEEAESQAARRAAMSHADISDAPDLSIDLTLDDNGQITGVGFVQTAETDMAQTIELGEDFLEHFGVKGMKWGVRKAESAGKGVAKATKATVRFAGDVQFERQIESGKARQAVIGKARTPFKKEDLPAIKARHGDYAKLRNRAKRPFSPEAKAYRKDAREAYIKRLETTANEMQNPSGNRQYTIRERGFDLPAEGGDLPTSKYYWDVSSRNVKHAAEDEFSRLEVVMEDGYITDLKPVDISLAQSALGEEFLEHFGVKGMKWGVRRNRPVPTAVTPTVTSRVPHGDRRKTKIDVEGGENHPAHDDALRVAQSRAKLKKSGTAALSNQELRELANRLQLENQVALLTSSKGKQFVSREFERGGQQLVKTGVKTGVKKHGPKVAKAAKKTVATAAVTALL